MRNYRTNSHSKLDLKVHPIWVLKYRKRILVSEVAERARDILRIVCMEHEVHIISEKSFIGSCSYVYLISTSVTGKQDS